MQAIIYRYLAITKHSEFRMMLIADVAGFDASDCYAGPSLNLGFFRLKLFVVAFALAESALSLGCCGGLLSDDLPLLFLLLLASGVSRSVSFVVEVVTAAFIVISRTEFIF
jgi:hypothetical protein